MPHTTALMALACVQLCAGPLLARPTRPIAHASTRRFVAPTQPRELSREHVARRPAKPPLMPRAGATTRSVPHRLADPADRPAIANAATLNRVHAWEEAQRSAAASAIAVADAPTRSGASSDGTASSSSQADSLTDHDATTTAPELPRIKSIEEEAATPTILPALRVLLFYDTSGRLIVPPPLYGSHEILLHQNQMAERDGLSRVQNDAGLLDLLREKKLVALPSDETIRVDYRLPANRRFSRPWTAQFLAILARDHFAAFHSPLQVDSAVRTVQFQRRLERTNGNAAPAAGETASPHLTGQAVDIAKSSLSLTEIAWMRGYLQPLIAQGKIDVEEEFQQACFHISVYRNYLPQPPHVTVAATRQSQPAAAY